MDVREKLLDMIFDSLCRHIDKSCKLAENIADDLIANGVTVQECKLGDKIYQADDLRIYESTIVEITLTAKHTIFVAENIAFDERAIGNSIFLSYAEAEAHFPCHRKENDYD